MESTKCIIGQNLDHWSSQKRSLQVSIQSTVSLLRFYLFQINFVLILTIMALIGWVVSFLHLFPPHGRCRWWPIFWFYFFNLVKYTLRTVPTVRIIKLENVYCIKRLLSFYRSWTQDYWYLHLPVFSTTTIPSSGTRCELTLAYGMTSSSSSPECGPDSSSMFRCRYKLNPMSFSVVLNSHWWSKYQEWRQINVIQSKYQLLPWAWFPVHLL